MYRSRGPSQAQQQQQLAARKVMDLAAEISEASDSKVTRLLIKLQDILDSYPAASGQLMRVKQDVWTYDLIQMMMVALKQDFNNMLNGWNTAAILVNILCQCCVGLDMKTFTEDQKKMLPTITEMVLNVACKLQHKLGHINAQLEDLRKEPLANFTSILDSVGILMGAHSNLPINVLKSSYLLQMLLTDDRQTGVVVMGTIQTANKLKLGALMEVDVKTIHTMMDELVYKLSSTSNVDVASASTRTITVMCDSHPPLVEILSKRFRGLRPLLNKWQGRGFGRDLNRLFILLESGTAKEAHTKKLDYHASKIQALWKSYYTRQQLKKASSGLAVFQRSFRKKRESTMQRKEDEKLQRELQHVLLTRRKQAMRAFDEKKLHALQILPADQVHKHLANEQTQAASKIQKCWRGHNTRRQIHDTKMSVRQVRAVVAIQRKVRQWLERVRAKKSEPPLWQRPPGLTDQRRVDIQAQINERREAQKPKSRTPEQLAEFHDEVQRKLRNQVTSSKITRKNQQHREALLARLDVDMTLLLDSPKLSQATEEDIEAYKCHSVPIASKARQIHNEELKMLNQPWWKKLGDEFQNKNKDLNAPSDWKLF